MKKLIVFAALIFTATAYAGPGIHDSLIERFKQLFPDAQETTWYNTDTYYEVCFINGNIRERIYYDLDGHTIRTLRYYTSKDINPFLAEKIAEKYKGKEIQSVTELQDESGITYQILLQDQNYLYKIRGNSNGRMKLLQKYLRA